LTSGNENNLQAGDRAGDRSIHRPRPVKGKL
jgi:hypothetical protein